MLGYLFLDFHLSANNQLHLPEWKKKDRPDQRMVDIVILVLWNWLDLPRCFNPIYSG